MPIRSTIYNMEAEPVGEQELSETVFGLKMNVPLVHQAAVAQLANERQVLSHTLGRSEVRGGGRKPWRQKGTGRARAGTIRSPLWKGGGIVFGPTNDRNYSLKINKKMKRNAICMVLSDRVRTGEIAIIDEIRMKDYKTKDFDAMLRKIEGKALVTAQKAGEKENKKVRRSLLVLQEGADQRSTASGRNLPGVTITGIDNISVLGLLKHKKLVLTKSAVMKLEERYASAKGK